MLPAIRANRMETKVFFKVGYSNSHSTKYNIYRFVNEIGAINYVESVMGNFKGVTPDSDFTEINMKDVPQKGILKYRASSIFPTEENIADAIKRNAERQKEQEEEARRKAEIDNKEYEEETPYFKETQIFVKSAISKSGKSRCDYYLFKTVIGSKTFEDRIVGSFRLTSEEEDYREIGRDELPEEIKNLFKNSDIYPTEKNIQWDKERKEEEELKRRKEKELEEKRDQITKEMRRKHTRLAAINFSNFVNTLKKTWEDLSSEKVEKDYHYDGISIYAIYKEANSCKSIAIEHAGKGLFFKIEENVDADIMPILTDDFRFVFDVCRLGEQVKNKEIVKAIADKNYTPDFEELTKNNFSITEEKLQSLNLQSLDDIAELFSAYSCQKRVKALTWTDEKDSSFVSKHTIGTLDWEDKPYFFDTYYIHEISKDREYNVRDLRPTLSRDLCSVASTLEEAKALCQKDFEAKVASLMEKGKFTESEIAEMEDLDDIEYRLESGDYTFKYFEYIEDPLEYSINDFRLVDCDWGKYSLLDPYNNVLHEFKIEKLTHEELKICRDIVEREYKARMEVYLYE